MASPNYHTSAHVHSDILYPKELSSPIDITSHPGSIANSLSHTQTESPQNLSQMLKELQESISYQQYQVEVLQQYVSSQASFFSVDKNFHSSVVCKYCKKPGHIQKDCRRFLGQCFLCGSIDHKKKSCSMYRKLSSASSSGGEFTKIDTTDPTTFYIEKKGNQSKQDKSSGCKRFGDSIPKAKFPKLPKSGGSFEGTSLSVSHGSFLVCRFCSKPGHLEKDCRRRLGLCLICGSGEHKKVNCPRVKKPSSSIANEIIREPLPSQEEEYNKKLQHDV